MTTMKYKLSKAFEGAQVAINEPGFPKLIICNPITITQMELKALAALGHPAAETVAEK